MYKYTIFIHSAYMNDIKIETEFIKLDAFLKWAGVASSGSEAKMLIKDELVTVNGEICTQRGKKLRVNDCVKFQNQEFKII